MLNDNLLTPAEVGQRIGRTRQAVEGYAVMSVEYPGCGIKAVRIGGGWRFHPDDVEEAKRVGVQLPKRGRKGE